MTVIFSQLGKYGRFGNQLFQIASTIGIARDNRMEYAFPSWKYQSYFKNELPLLDTTKSYYNFEEQVPYYHKINLLKPHNYDLHGYFQSYKYFDKYKQSIEHYFAFKDEIDIHVDYVSIHVRRGDYLNLDNHPVLSEDYYRSAISLFPTDTIFIVFSDDIEWCEHNFLVDRELIFSSANDLISDFIAMKHCQHNIIANSSFSWWAAYLNTAKNKKVIAPSIYVNNEVHTDDRYPKDWIVI